MNWVERIKGIREDHDYKQETVAKALGISQQQYHLYESGKRKLPIDKLILLCKLYNISADYLLGMTDELRSIK